MCRGFACVDAQRNPCAVDVLRAGATKPRCEPLNRRQRNGASCGVNGRAMNEIERDLSVWTFCQVLEIGAEARFAASHCSKIMSDTFELS